MKKLLVVGVIVLFLGLAIAPSISSESSEVIGNSPRWEQEIRYYDPTSLAHWIWLCWGEPPYYLTTAIRLTQDELSSYTEWNLTKVRFRMDVSGQTEFWASLIIYGEGTSTQPGNIIYEDDTLYFDATGFHIIELDTPIAIDDHNEIWIGINWEITEDQGFPISTDEKPAVPLKGDWINWDGSNWHELRDYGMECNFYIGAIVEYEDTELSIINVTGPLGVKAEVKNIGNVPAYNVHYLMIVSGGIFNMIFRIASDTIPELVPDETIPMYSDLIFGLGPININITVSASNAYKIFTSKTGFILGPFVFLG